MEAIEKRKPTRRGLQWIFEYCIVYTGHQDPDPEDQLYHGYQDILTMGRSKRRRKKMGLFYGVIMGEVPDLDPHSPEGSRILYEWIRDDPRIEEHKRVKNFLRKHPEIKQDLRRDAIRDERGEVVRDAGGRAKKTQRLKPLDKFK